MSDMYRKTLSVRYHRTPDTCLLSPDNSYPNPGYLLSFRDINIFHISSKLQFLKSSCVSNSLWDTSVKYRRVKKFLSHRAVCHSNNKLKTSARNEITFVLAQQSLQIADSLLHTELNIFSLRTKYYCLRWCDKIPFLQATRSSLIMNFIIPIQNTSLF